MDGRPLKKSTVSTQGLALKKQQENIFNVCDDMLDTAVCGVSLFDFS